MNFDEFSNSWNEDYNNETFSNSDINNDNDIDDEIDDEVEDQYEEENWDNFEMNDSPKNDNNNIIEKDNFENFCFEKYNLEENEINKNNTDIILYNKNNNLIQTWNFNFNINEIIKFKYFKINELKKYFKNLLESYTIYTLNLKINNKELFSYKRFKQMYNYHQHWLIKFPYHIFPKFPDKNFLNKLYLMNYDKMDYRNKSIIYYFNILLENFSIHENIEINKFFKNDMKNINNFQKNSNYYNNLSNEFKNDLKLMDTPGLKFNLKIFDKNKNYEDINFEYDFEIRSWQSELKILKDNWVIVLNNLKKFYSNQENKYNLYTKFDNIFNLIYDNINKNYNKTIEEIKKSLENKKQEAVTKNKDLNENFIFNLNYIFENIESVEDQINKNFIFKTNFSKIFNENNSDIDKKLEVLNIFKNKIEYIDDIFLKEIHNFLKITEYNLENIIGKLNSVNN